MGSRGWTIWLRFVVSCLFRALTGRARVRGTFGSGGGAVGRQGRPVYVVTDAGDADRAARPDSCFRAATDRFGRQVHVAGRCYVLVIAAAGGASSHHGACCS